MRWGLILVTIFGWLSIAAGGPAWAADAQPPADAPPPAEAPPATPPPAKPATPAPKPVITPADIAQRIAPDLLAALRQAYISAGRGDAGVTGPDNVVILSKPDGCEVYLALVSDIRSARNPDGSEAAVETVLFSPDHYLGDAPVISKVPSGDYVLGVRSYGYTNGFDGSCVRKSTTDVITGGVRHAYHLYPLRKREGEFQLFIANFDTGATAPGKQPKPSATSGIFRADPAVIAQELAAGSNVPEEKQAAAAARLLHDGLLFYENAGTAYLLKLTLLGASFHLDEWPVE